MDALISGATMTVTTGINTITFSDVLVGEVWVISGQSNVNVLLSNCDGGTDAVRTSGKGPIRKRSLSYVRGNTVVIGFDYAEGGLFTDSNASPGPFMIAGADGVYYDADAQVLGSTIEVSSPHVPSPKFVRYGWEPDPVCNIFNSSGLPASPFQIEF